MPLKTHKIACSFPELLYTLQSRSQGFNEAMCSLESAMYSINSIIVCTILITSVNQWGKECIPQRMGGDSDAESNFINYCNLQHALWGVCLYTIKEFACAHSVLQGSLQRVAKKWTVDNSYQQTTHTTPPAKWSLHPHLWQCHNRRKQPWHTLLIGEIS